MKPKYKRVILKISGEDLAGESKFGLNEEMLSQVAKQVEHVYSEGPEKNPNATRYETLTHKEVLERGLGVMDSTAASLCMDNNIPVHVFGLAQEGNILKAILGEKIGTIIT